MTTTILRLAACIGLGAALGSRAMAQQGASPYYYCTILDAEQESAWNLGGGYVLEGSNNAEGWDDLGVINLNASAGLVYLETDRGGDLDLRVFTDTRILQGFDGTASGYPLSIIALDFQYEQRFDYGWGMQIEFMPGLYSTLDQFSGDDLAFPFSLSGVRALNEQLSVQLGLSIYPTFDRVVDPKFGLRWVPNEDLLIDLFYPESKIQVTLVPGVDVHLGARFLAWLEYQMDEDDPRERVQYDEFRLTAGLGLQTSEYGKWTFDLGYYFDRDIDFDKGMDGIVDIDDEFGFSIGYVSLF